jgi:hypothetical protein
MGGTIPAPYPRLPEMREIAPETTLGSAVRRLMIFIYSCLSIRVAAPYGIY